VRHSCRINLERNTPWEVTEKGRLELDFQCHPDMLPGLRLGVNHNSITADHFGGELEIERSWQEFTVGKVLQQPDLQPPVFDGDSLEFSWIHSDDSNTLQYRIVIHEDESIPWPVSHSFDRFFRGVSGKIVGGRQLAIKSEWNPSSGDRCIGRLESGLCGHRISLQLREVKMLIL